MDASAFEHALSYSTARFDELTSARDFLRKLSALEAEHAASLQKLVDKHLPRESALLHIHPRRVLRKERREQARGGLSDSQNGP